MGRLGEGGYEKKRDQVGGGRDNTGREDPNEWHCGEGGDDMAT